MESQKTPEKQSIRLSGWFWYHILISLIPIIWSAFRQEYFRDALSVAGIILISGLITWLISSLDGLILVFKLKSNKRPSGANVIVRLIVLFTLIVPVIWAVIEISPVIKRYILTVLWPWLSGLFHTIYLKLLSLPSAFHVLSNSRYSLALVLLATLSISMFLRILLRDMAEKVKLGSIRLAAVPSGWHFLRRLLYIFAIILEAYSILYLWSAVINADSYNIAIAAVAVLSSSIIIVLLSYIDRWQLLAAAVAANGTKLLSLLISLLIMIGIAIAAMARDVALSLSTCQHFFRLVGLVLMLASIYQKIKHRTKSDGKEIELEIDISKKSGKYIGSYEGLLLLVGAGLMICPSFICKNENSPTPPNLPQTPTPTPTPSVAGSIREVIEAVCSLPGKHTEYYNIKIHPNDEVIKDKKGKYFEIRLRDAKRKEELFFDLGKYRLDEFSEAFDLAMDAVKKDIIDIVSSGGVKYKVYIKGRADIVGDRKQVIDNLVGRETITIQYLLKNPIDPGNQWLPQTGSAEISKTYNNKQLPNLRAWYSKEKLDTLNIAADILDGEVTLRESPKDRQALILLYWPDPQLCKQ